MHKGKEKKATTTTHLVCAWHQNFLFIAAQLMDGREREVACVILPDRSEFDLWYYCVCASITALLMTSSETTLKQRCPWKGHQLFSIHVKQLYQCRKAEVSEQNSGFCSVFSPTDLPSVVADKSASGHVQEAPVCSVEVGSLLSMQSTFLPLPVQLSAVPVLSLQIILTLFIALHPLSPTSAVWNSPLICQPRQSSNCFQTFFKKISLLSFLSSLGFFPPLWFLCGHSS